MKFNKHLPKWRQEFLENEYKQYCKTTTMTSSERRALREWVKDGNSVYENASGVWAEGNIPVEFLTIYRDEEYIMSIPASVSHLSGHRKPLFRF